MNTKFLFLSILSFGILAQARAINTVQLTVKNSSKRAIWANLIVEKPGHLCVMNIQRGFNFGPLGVYIDPNNQFSFQVNTVCCGAPSTLHIQANWQGKDRSSLPLNSQESYQYDVQSAQCIAREFTITEGANGKLIMTQN